MYCEPEFLDYGATSYGWKGFGGLLFSSTDKFIPQYNLEAAWKLRLTSYSGVDQGLLFGCCAESVYRYRTPGHYRHDVESVAVLNRNLICLNSLPGELNIVKEHSDRKIVESYNVQTLGTSRAFPNFLRHCDPDPDHIHTYDEQISELRSSTGSDAWNFFVRCRSKFYAVDRNKESHEIFKGSIISWEQNPVMPDEISIVGRDCMLWSGVIGQSFGRTKTTGGKPLKAITYSGHPRVLLAADDLQIRSLDIRCDTQTTSNLLFCSPRFSEELYDMRVYKDKHETPAGTHIYPLEIPTWAHIKTLDQQAHSLLAVSTYSVYLLDDRVPGKSVLSNNHCLLNGAHLLAAGKPIDDPHGSGQVQSFYLLDQFSTGLWKMEIYKHRSEDWSAVKPLHGVPDPGDRKFILGKKQPGDNSYVHPPTRGIAVISQMDEKRPKEILFRYMDDSSVMYKTYYYGLDVNEEKQMEAACLERSILWEKEKREINAEELADTFGEGIMKPPEAQCKSVGVDVGIPKKRYFIPYPLNPLTKEVVPTIPSQPLQSSHPDAYYSKIVNSFWNELKGFRGSHSLSGLGGSPPPGSGDGAQLSQTYSALCSLVILGDDLSRVDRKAILSRIKESQNEEGSFWSQGEGSECDMRYVFIAVAICHILKDESVIDWDRLKKFMRQALRYDGGIGQGYDDESHGGSTYCAIAALALSNRLWDYSVYSEKEIRKLIKWAVYKQDEGMHGRAHKEDDCCYAFWIGATLNILNAHEFLDLPRLRRFLCNAQHQKWGGFCKLVTTEYSDCMPLVSIVDPDLSQEETVVRILQAKEQFNLIANSIFSKLNARITDISKNLEDNISRFERIKNKISTLDKFETAVVLKAPSKFPDVEYVPARRILPFIPGVVAHGFSESDTPFGPKNALGGIVDIKSELEHRKQFFATSQMMPVTQEIPKEQAVPSDVFSIADLFFVDSERAAYDKVGGSFICHSSKSKSLTSRQDQNLLKDNLDRTAIGDRRKFDDSDIFAFRPLSTDVPDLELPDFLPDLPGVALDVVMTDLQGVVNKTFQDYEQKVTLPDIEASGGTSLTQLLPLVSSAPIEEKPTLTPIVSPLLPSSNIPTVVPPPPPPPPPSFMAPPAPPPLSNLKTPMTSPSENGGRSDLMAAIRAAGGVGKVKLKNSDSTLNTRQTEEKLSLRDSSALSSSTGGGDLMSSLTKALEARRKAMTGINTFEKQPKPASITGVMSRISDMIPSPEKSGTHSDSGGEDWT